MLWEGTHVRHGLFRRFRELRCISVLLPNVNATQVAVRCRPFYPNLPKINADAPSRQRPPSPARLMTTTLTQLVLKLQVRSCHPSASSNFQGASTPARDSSPESEDSRNGINIYNSSYIQILKRPHSALQPLQPNIQRLFQCLRRHFDLTRIALLPALPTPWKNILTWR